MKWLVWKLLNFLNKYIARPRMIVGYKRYDGKYLSDTRLSNTVDIVCPQKFIVENNVWIWHHSILECSNEVTIGMGCQIGAFVLILSHSSHYAIRLYGHHYIKHNGKHLGYIKGSVHIGAYTFIGPHTVIMPNVKIGKGSIVSAYSLVKSGEYPEFAIIAGNPAKVVGDTRNIDKNNLQQYPELQVFYDEWAK